MSSVSGVRTGAMPGVGRGRRQRGGVFEPLPQPAGDAQATATVAPAALAGALALQEVGCEAPQDRMARRRGYDLLAALRALQRGLLGDCIDTASLRELAALSTGAPEAADPGLREAVAALVLRARVELARHES